MTRSKQILALLTSTAALTAFAPAVSAASEDGRYRVASVKPSARVMVVAPAQMSAAKFAPARMSAAKFSVAGMNTAKYSAARISAAKSSAARMRAHEWSEPVRR